MKQKKLLSIFTLPLLWIIYFLFELFTGRIDTIEILLGNFALILVFTLVGYFIYRISLNFPNGLSTKKVTIILFITLLIDQLIKLIIKLFFFSDTKVIIKNLLAFNPIINTDGSWLNARFNFNVSFPLLIFVNIVALLIFLEVYRYLIHNGHKSFWIDMAFIFITVGALCSLIDKIFYGGSLDFIGISDLFIADIKDIYINLGLLFFIMSTYKSEWLDDSTSFKDDLSTLKKFFRFVIKDLSSIIKKEKV